MKTPVNFPRNTLTLSVCAWLFAVVPLFAQSTAPASVPRTATSPDAVPAAEPEPTILSPFRVNDTKDVGYRATNATSGTRLNTPIKDLPMPIEVITQEFMRDIGATNLRDSLAYSAGVVLDSQSDFSNPDAINHPSDNTHGATGSPSQTVIKLRGFITTEALRNGYRRANASDSINIDRIEVIRGPSALLYGIGNFGGVVNYITKRPTTKQSYAVGLFGGTWNWFRTQADISGPIGDRAGYRLTGATEKTKDYTDFAGYDYRFISPVFEFRPTKTTNIVVDLERAENTQKGIGFLSIPATVKGVTSSRGFNPVLPDPNPRTYRWSGPDTFRHENDSNLSAEVTQSFTPDLTLLVGGQLSEVKADTRNVRATINLSAPTFVDPKLIQSISFFPAGLNPRLNRSGFLSSRWTEEWEDTDTKQSRVELNYKFTVGNTEHNLLLGRSDQVRTYGDIANGQSQPLSAANDSFRAFSDTSYFRFDPAVHPLTTQTNQQIESWDSGDYFVYQGKYFSNKLQIVAGLRYDRSDTRTTFNDLVTGQEKSVVNSILGKPATKTSPQAGVSYAITKEISAYALYSTGLSPNYDKLDGNGSPLKPTTSRSKEVGVKIDLLDGKISGTISAYQIQRRDTSYYVFWAPNNTYHGQAGRYDNTKPLTWEIGGARPGDYYQVYDEANPADLAIIQQQVAGQNAPNFINGQNVQTDVSQGYGNGNNPSLDQGAYTPVDDESKGYDLQIILSPVRNWQTILTYAHVNRKLTQGPALVKYKWGFDPYALWYIQAESPVDKYGGGGISHFSSPQDTSTYDRSFGKGLAADDTPPDQFNIFTHYEFATGNLRGLGAGAGFQYVSTRDGSGDGLTDNGGFVKSTYGNTAIFANEPSKYLVNAVVSYRAMWDKHEWRLSLNVYNLLDNQKKYGLNYQEPRKIRFGATVAF
ncbi:MAG: TonB-dependent receptor [Verrucomicrobia bacterium]|nr:TonB-dependent receptor [Verrucomicrobiota bacterium]